MANYLIDRMTWSYSRLTCYQSCPYKFYLKYIEQLEDEPLFLSEYGAFVHRLLASFYLGQVSRRELVNRYVTGFRKDIRGKPPSEKIFSSYFSHALQSLQNIQPPEERVSAVEEYVRFRVGDYSFAGIIDLLLCDDDGNVTIVDHKSRILKPPSGRRQPTRSDLELDEYLKQLYLYSIPVIDQTGSAPIKLSFHCFRAPLDSKPVEVPFRPEKLEAAKKWALDTIHAIENEREWKPDYEYFKCHHICGLHKDCIYYSLQNGKN